jgi:hypothetical protein
MSEKKVHIKILWKSDYSNIDWILLCNLLEAPDTSEWISIDIKSSCHGMQSDWEHRLSDDLYDYSAE